ncbi:MAG: hypothetical protein AABW71_00435 [Nanoarchaeota archaeon]
MANINNIQTPNRIANKIYYSVLGLLGTASAATGVYGMVSDQDNYAMGGIIMTTAFILAGMQTARVNRRRTQDLQELERVVNQFR